MAAATEDGKGFFIGGPVGPEADWSWDGDEHGEMDYYDERETEYYLYTEGPDRHVQVNGPSSQTVVTNGKAFQGHYEGAKFIVDENWNGMDLQEIK